MEMRSIHAMWIAPSLPSSPIWNATETVVASLPPMPNATNISSVPGCHLPVLDPWNPDIPQFFFNRPRMVSLLLTLLAAPRKPHLTCGGYTWRANTTFIWISLKQIYDAAINQMCSTEQNSLVFIDIDSLTFNETALQELGLLESQVPVILITMTYTSNWLLQCACISRFQVITN